MLGKEEDFWVEKFWVQKKVGSKKYVESKRILDSKKKCWFKNN